jgi:hypothetical protein
MTLETVSRTNDSTVPETWMRQRYASNAQFPKCNCRDGVRCSGLPGGSLHGPSWRAVSGSADTETGQSSISCVRPLSPSET